VELIHTAAPFGKNQKAKKGGWEKNNSSGVLAKKTNVEKRERYRTQTTKYRCLSWSARGSKNRLRRPIFCTQFRGGGHNATKGTVGSVREPNRNMVPGNPTSSPETTNWERLNPQSEMKTRTTARRAFRNGGRGSTPRRTGS